jgi:hypothetical protein
MKLTFLFSLLLQIAKIKLFSLEEIQNELSNPYRVLGIAPWASSKEIKTKYTELVKKYHPDHSTGTESQKKFMEVQKAWERIKTRNKIIDNEDTEDNRIVDVLTHLLMMVLLVSLILFAVYVCLWLSYTLFLYSWRYMFFLVTLMSLFEFVIPHYFDSFTKELIIGSTTSLVIVNFRRILSILFPGAKKVDNRSHSKTE